MCHAQPSLALFLHYALVDSSTKSLSSTLINLLTLHTVEERAGLNIFWSNIPS
jgi:hypothetical protein